MHPGRRDGARPPRARRPPAIGASFPPLGGPRRRLAPQRRIETRRASTRSRKTPTGCSTRACLRPPGAVQRPRCPRKTPGRTQRRPHRAPRRTMRSRPRGRHAGAREVAPSPALCTEPRSRGRWRADRAPRPARQRRRPWTRWPVRRSAPTLRRPAHPSLPLRAPLA